MIESLLRVLYVDDDSNDRTMFGIMAERVEGTGIWLYTVDNAQQAIDYFEGKGQYADRSLYQIPEVVVIDLHMPGGGGFDFLQWHRSSPQFARVPVVVLTASLHPGELERVKAMQIAGLFEKSGALAAWESAVKAIYAIGLQHRGSR